MDDGATGKSGRLYSLDLLRGFDIFLLTVLCGFVGNVNGLWKLPEWFMDQFRHPDWVGFSAHDMIMPLFIFMCGAALPLALPKRLEPDGSAGGKYWLHVLKRVALLWFFGMIAQGELLSFDIHRISFFNNTLQTIACGYLIAAVVARIPSKWVRLAIPFALAAAYTAFLHLCGNTLSPTDNAAVVYEVKFLTLFYPDVTWHPVNQIAAWHYTWWPTIPMFGAMGLAGYHATSILKGGMSGAAKMKTMVGVGVGLLALGGILAWCGDPIVKHIFTASFTALAMGVAYLLYALCYFLADLCGWRRGTGLITLFGRHSLFAYMYGCFFGGATALLVNRFIVNGASGPTRGALRFLSQPAFNVVHYILYAIVFCTVIWYWDRRRCK